MRSLLINDEVLDGIDNSILSKYTADQELLELAQFIRVATGHGGHFRLSLIVPSLPLLVVASNVLNESLVNVSKSVKFDSVFPVLQGHPLDGAILHFFK